MIPRDVIEGARNLDPLLWAEEDFIRHRATLARRIGEARSYDEIRAEIREFWAQRAIAEQS